jgi:Derlin-1
MGLFEGSNGGSFSTTTILSTTISSPIRTTFGVRLPQNSESTMTTEITAYSILKLRGGASKRKATATTKTVTGKKKVSPKQTKGDDSPVGDFMVFLKKVPKFTRYYMCAMVGITIMGNVIGEERAHAAFSLDPMRVLLGMELWRPFAAACFLGAPSMNWVLNLYNLFNYGTQLENAFGGAQFLVFMITQLVIISILATVLGQPFIGQAVITGMLHVLARSKPNEQVTWYIMRVPYFSLPYLNALADFFNAQGSFGAMIPHVIGILAGHFYFFHKTLWPAMENGEDWLVAPEFLEIIVDGKEKVGGGNVKGKRKGGRKLGSAASAGAA